MLTRNVKKIQNLLGTSSYLPLETFPGSVSEEEVGTVRTRTEKMIARVSALPRPHLTAKLKSLASVAVVMATDLRTRTRSLWERRGLTLVPTFEGEAPILVKSPAFSTRMTLLLLLGPT